MITSPAFLLQSNNGIMHTEKLAILNGLLQHFGAAKTQDMVTHCSLRQIETFRQNGIANSRLKNNPIPVGSVEFCRAYATLLGVSLPEQNPYPPCLLPHLKRKIHSDIYGLVPAGMFVKPKHQTKLFSGHIIGAFPSHETAPADIANTVVYVAEPVQWLSEYRYYVADGGLIGFSRYDDGEADTNIPDEGFVADVIARLTHSGIRSAAIDFGVLVNVETALIEVNGPWAIGYYPSEAMSKLQYIDFLSRGWRDTISLNNKADATLGTENFAPKLYF